MNKRDLKALIIGSLRRQGFRLHDGGIQPPTRLDKQRLRDLHREAVRHRIDTAAAGLRRHEDKLLGRIASGNEIVPELVAPTLVAVEPGSEDELLFRYATLHWSVATSSGYGRRLRFIILDKQNGKLIGIFGLGDPVFRLGDRDTWIGWKAATQSHNLRHVMDAFVLGAVPPYSFLLCGKLTAMLVASNEVRNSFRRCTVSLGR